MKSQGNLDLALAKPPLGTPEVSKTPESNTIVGSSNDPDSPRRIISSHRPTMVSAAPIISSPHPIISHPITSTNDVVTPIETNISRINSFSGYHHTDDIEQGIRSRRVRKPQSGQHTASSLHRPNLSPKKKRIWKPKHIWIQPMVIAGTVRLPHIYITLK